MRNASDNIRNAMNMLMEVALLVGSIFAAIKMAGYTGFSIAVAIYFLNESLGRPVQKITGLACSFRLKEGTYEDVSFAKPDAY